MKIKTGNKYIVENAGLLKGKHVVTLEKDMRGGIPGGYEVKSLETGRLANINSTELMPYRRELSPFWMGILTNLIVGIMMFFIGRYYDKIVTKVMTLF